MRVHLSLNVRNLEEAMAYYSKLFNTQPHKIRDGYANYAIDNPPLKLVLMENPNADDRINHMGVEVTPDEDLPAHIRRLDDAGLTDKKEEQTTCCYAIQDKAWSIEPQGIHWEWYTVTDDNPDVVADAAGEICCTPSLKSNDCC